MTEPFLLISIVIVSILVYDILTKNSKRLRKIRFEWETGKFVSSDESFKSISSYWLNRKKTSENYAGIDQLTWDDLAMDEVFKKLNYTQSSVGSEYLFNQLRDINPSLTHNHEEVYKLFANEPQVREKVLLILSGLGKQSFTNSSSFFHDLHESKLKHAFLYVILSLLPFVSILLMFFNLKYGIVTLSISILLNAIIYYRNKSKMEGDLLTVAYAAAVIDTGKRLAAITHPAFSMDRKAFVESVRPLKKVIPYSKFISIGRGGSGAMDVFFEYLRIIFLLDFISYNRITRTISTNQKEYGEVWTHIGQLDAAIAVAFYRKSLDTYCTPDFWDKEEVVFNNMVHPLITNAIPNTSSLGKNTLITGSNASGKSTYIKGVAINAILVQTINTAIAESWTMRPSYVVTSMAIQDNLLAGDSYFIAEIKSLKRIIQLIEEGKPCLSFIDEILKGTNTIERIAASAAMMEWLSKNKGMNVLASHDIELTEIAGAIYTNYHFTESIENGKIQFDYKIHSGPSKSRNAIKLLEMLAYPTSITNQAIGLAEHFAGSHEWLPIGNSN